MRYLINVLFSVALGLLFTDIVTELFAGRKFDESALYTIVYGFEGVNYSGFYKEISIITLCLFITIIIAIFLHRIPIIGRLVHDYKFISLVICLSVIITSNPIKTVSSAYFGLSLDLASYNRDEIYFETRFQETGKYEKNLVFIYLESFERSYLDGNRYPKLAPNLSDLAHQADQYTNVYALVSAAWTMGGKVASQCGVPLITPLGAQNNLAKIDSFLPGAVCVGDVLSKAGYSLEYIGGAKKEFAGKNKFYTNHGFNSVRGLDELKRANESPWSWGRSDEKTFADVLQRYEALQKDGEPFGLFSLTLDTHGPDGHVPEVCGALTYGDGSSRMLNAVHCNDQIVGDFIREIRSHPKFSNTVLVLASDHPLGGDLYEDHRRNLFLVFDGASEAKEYAKEGTPFDIGATVLGYMTNPPVDVFGLGRNLRNSHGKTLAETAGGPENVDKFVSAKRETFSGYWNIPASFDGIKLVDVNTALIEKQKFTLPILINLKGENISGIVLEELGALTETFHNFAKAVRERQDAVLIANCGAIANYISDPDISLASSRDVCSLTTSRSNVQSIIKLTSGLSYAKRDLFPQIDLLHSQVRLKSLDAIIEFNSVPEFIVYQKGIDSISFEIVSVGLNAGAKSTIRIGDVVLDSSLRRGLNIVKFSTTGDAAVIDVLDTCLPKLREDEKLIKDFLEELLPGENLAIAVHDSAFCGNAERLMAVFEGSGFDEGAKLRLREPYVAMVTNNAKIEYRGNVAFPLIVSNDDFAAHFARLSH